MGSSDSKSVSTYSFSFPSNDFSIHGIYPDEKKIIRWIKKDYFDIPLQVMKKNFQERNLTL